MGPTMHLQPPGLSHQPALGSRERQTWGRNERDLGSEPASPPQLSPVVGSTAPQQCQERRGKPRTGHRGAGRLLAAHLKVSLLAPAAGSARRQPEPCTTAGCKGPAGSQAATQTPNGAFSSPSRYFHQSCTRLACISEGQPSSSYQAITGYFLLQEKYGFGARNGHPNNITEICTYLLWYVCMIPTS